MLEADGWFLVRPRGSHRQYKHSVKLGLLTVPGKPGDDLAPGTLNMEETTVLFRPVVENELGRIAESGFRSFPPGLPGSPFFIRFSMRSTRLKSRGTGRKEFTLESRICQTLCG